MAEMWLYNGVELPALPEHDPELYEAAIFAVGTFYYLVLQEIGYGFYGVHDVGNYYFWYFCLDSEDAPIQVYMFDSNNPNFTVWIPIETDEITEASLIPVWTNTEDSGHARGFHDADTDELILESSEPVPVTSPEEPEQPEEPDVPEEPTKPLSFIKFLVSPKRPGLPKNIWGWKMAQKQGSSTTPKVFTYDGGEDAEFFDINGLRAVRLSEDVFDLSKITKIECMFANGTKAEFAKGDFELVDWVYDLKAAKVTLGSQSAPVVFAHPDGGLLGYAQPGWGYLSYVEFA